MLRKLQEAMLGRNGPDKLGGALLVFAFLLGALARFWPVIFLFSLAVAFLAVWRAFSKNLAARRAENYRFTHIAGDIKDAFEQMRFRRAQARSYKFFTCKSCKSKLRVPRGKGSVFITCPKCGQKFKGKT